jgi:hypothetical protein
MHLSKTTKSSFDHLVGEYEQRRRDGEGERVCRLEIDTPQRDRTISCKIVRWRATVDEDGHYSFAVAL